MFRFLLLLSIMVLMYSKIHFTSDVKVVGYKANESSMVVTGYGNVVGVTVNLVVQGSPLNTFKRHYHAFTITVPKDYTKGAWLNYLSHEQYRAYLNADKPGIGTFIKVDTTLSEMYGWMPLVSLYGIGLIFVLLQHLSLRKRK